MRSKVFLLAMAGLCCGMAGGPKPETRSDEPVTISAKPVPMTARVLEGGAAFAVDLYQALGSPPGNRFFSPYSLSMALAMTYGGAGGDTAAQMARVLRLPADDPDVHAALGQTLRDTVGRSTQDGIEVTIVNSLWPQQGYPLRDEFLERCRTHYKAMVEPVDYETDADAARTAINRWVDTATRGRITDLVPEGALTDMTRLVLANAIYFKGMWEHAFDPAETGDQPFHTPDGGTVSVPTMVRQAAFGYAELDGLQILELPYRGLGMSMVILLPEARDGLPALEAGLTGAQLDRWTLHVPTQEVRVTLPRFRLTSEFDLGDTLVAMGMRDAFDVQRADFSGMDGRQWLYLTRALHKAEVEVAEEGTEASAATAVVVGLKSMPPPVPECRVDRPFMFMIRDSRNGAVLFLGRVVDPSQS